MMCDFRRTFQPTSEEQAEDVRKLKKIWDENVKKRGCTTCANCEHVRHYPDFVTGEEHECKVGLKCDTILGTVKNCEKYVEDNFYGQAVIE